MQAILILTILLMMGLPVTDTYTKALRDEIRSGAYADSGTFPSLTKIMKRFGLSFDDVDVFECNEAFAAQNLSVIREMEDQTGKKIDMEKWNPNGGAIAFGHPNGASGGRIAMHAMDELQKTGGRYGIFSSCCGGGLGVSTLIERYEV